MCSGKQLGGGAPVENPRRTTIVEAKRELAGNCGNQAEQSNTKSSRQPETKRAGSHLWCSPKPIFTQPPMGYNPENPGLINEGWAQEWKAAFHRFEENLRLVRSRGLLLLAPGQVQAGEEAVPDYINCSDNDKDPGSAPAELQGEGTANCTMDSP